MASSGWPQITVTFQSKHGLCHTENRPFRPRHLEAFSQGVEGEQSHAREDQDVGDDDEHPLRVGDERPGTRQKEWASDQPCSDVSYSEFWALTALRQHLDEGRVKDTAQRPERCESHQQTGELQDARRLVDRADMPVYRLAGGEVSAPQVRRPQPQ